jgi:hypothetical protein
MSTSENSTIRDEKTGRFLPGNSGGPGRSRGSRNRLGEQYLADLKDVWETHGRAALIAAASEEPARFCQMYASLLPRQLDVDVDIVVREAQSALEAYRTLKALPPAELRKLHLAERGDD